MKFSIRKSNPISYLPRRAARACALLATTVFVSPALAGEEVLYAPTPDWVAETSREDIAVADGPAQVLWDWQHRLEGGVVYQFTDRAVRIDNPEMQMEQNQLSLSWLPDKGDLTVHRLELHRDGEVVDLIAEGETFEVLRREMGLEDRLLDGKLTATLSVPGMRVGDVLRVSHSISVDDQALGEEVQALQYLPTEPQQLGSARAIMSWPVAEEMYWGVEDKVALEAPETRDGYNYLTVELPLAEPAQMPADAPYRFRRPSVLRVGSFADWAELSDIMAPHYREAAVLAADSEVAQQARIIMAATDDPLERTAKAVRLVQEEVSYLLDGLDGGNYLPQSADETWEVRYGDCKAKTVLLLALLREMGIEAEAALVSTRQGDAVPELLPLPAAFDHVIVHAVIDGKDYWLDGTMNGTRMSTLADVPTFHHALPIREGGSDLAAIVPRAPELPQMTMAMSVDHTAGIDFPSLFNMKISVVGPAGTRMRALVDEENPAVLRQLATRFSSNEYEMVISDLSIDYDEEAALATIQIEGITQPSFEWRNGRLRSKTDGYDQNIDFNPDRARRAWRDIPVATNGPSRMRVEMTMLLPDEGEGFTLDGPQSIDAGYGNLTSVQTNSLENGAMSTLVDVVSLPGEIASEDVSETKRAARRFANTNVELVPPQNVTWAWELDKDDRARRARPILAAYDAAIEFSDVDDFLPLEWRAFFNLNIYDYDEALSDLDEVIEESPSVWAFQNRSDAHYALGNDQLAIADLEAAYDLEPTTGNALILAELLAHNDRRGEAQDLLDALVVSENEQISFNNTLATIIGLEGDVDTGFSLIEDNIQDQPQNSTALNEDCWFRGRFNHALETALERCTQAVERASNAASALDSRALVHFRFGDYAAAVADLDAALDLSPDLAESRYLRGIVRLHSGDSAGRIDIDQALVMVPNLPKFYDQYGITPPD